MRSAHPSAWFQRSNKKSQTTEPVQSHNQSPFPFLSSSRSPAPPSSFTSLHLARSKDARPSSSAASFRSAYSAASGSHHSVLRTDTHTPELHSHPFASMVHAPLPVVSSHDSSEEEEECPVCLEPLSFSFRLPGEKPHIVPECGHSLHEVCVHFTFRCHRWYMGICPIWSLNICVVLVVSETTDYRPVPVPLFSLMATLFWSLSCSTASFRTMSLRV